MTYTETTSGVLGATRQTWRTQSIRDLLAELVTANPKADDKRLLKLFVEALRDNEEYFVAAAEYAFDNALRALRREQRKPSAAEKAIERAAERAKHVKLVAKIKKGIMLLNLVMPNGKKLSQCSGTECLHFGGWYERVGEVVGDRMVGDVLEEKDLRALYKA